MSLRLRINGIYREAEVIPAPKGVYVINHGQLPCYPIAIAVSVPIVSNDYQDEATQGSVICAPIMADGASDYLRFNEIYNEVNESNFRELLCYAMDFDFFESETEAIQYLKEDFERHGTPIHPSATKWIKERLAELLVKDIGK